MIKFLFTLTIAISFSNLQAILPPNINLNASKDENRIISKKECKDFITKMERVNKIPEGLLTAIAAVESEHNPWAINCGKFSRAFASQEAAVKFVKDLRLKGKVDINIGILQINYGAHKTKFKTAEEILSPSKNIKYAANYLVYLKKTYGSWKKAVCFYHSPCPKYQNMYWKKVTNALKKYNIESYNKITSESVNLNLKLSKN